MIKPRALTGFALLLTALGFLASCVQQTADRGGGTGGTGMVARGVITSKGGESITVNTVSYRTTATTNIVGSNALQTGMIVTVRGLREANGLHGTAEEIVYTNTVAGALKVPGTGSSVEGFSIYGQQVSYHLPVTFVGRDGSITTKSAAADPVPDWMNTSGTVVEVSGFALSDGSVEVTYVKRLESSELEFLGLVTAVHPAAVPPFILVNGMRVETPDAGDYSVGMYVHVHANAPDENASGITADDIEIKDLDLGGDEHEEGELEGVITALAADHSWFDLAGQRVVVAADTEFEDGLTRGGLAIDQHIEVHGHFSGGQFLADEIERD